MPCWVINVQKEDCPMVSAEKADTSLLSILNISRS